MPANHDCGCEKEANPHPDNALQLLEALGAEIAKMPSEDMFDLPVGRVRAAFQNVYDIAAGMLGVDVLAKPNTSNGKCSDYPGWNFKEWKYKEIGDLTLNTAFPMMEAVCWNPRTLNPSNEVSHSALADWWNSLGKGNPQRSTTAKEIEVALASPETQDATFDHIPEHTFDFVADWIEGNRATIVDKASRFGVHPALVAGILACEMLFDYNINDKGNDEHGIDLRGTFAAGFANVHLDTALLAREYFSIRYSQQTINPADDIPWPLWRLELVSSGIVVKPSFLEKARQYREYLMTDAGAITVTALVARWLRDPYLSEESKKDLIPFANIKERTLTSEDMAVIFGAYRAGITDWSPPGSIGYGSIPDYQTTLADPGLGDNGKLALPVMEYMLTQFHG